MYEHDFMALNKVANSDLLSEEKERYANDMIKDMMEREIKFEKYRRVIDAINRGDEEYLEFISNNLYLLD